MIFLNPLVAIQVGRALTAESPKIKFKPLSKEDLFSEEALETPNQLIKAVEKLNKAYRGTTKS